MRRVSPRIEKGRRLSRAGVPETSIAGPTLEEAEPTEKIIGAAIAVHRALGPGFLETVYEEASAVELTARGLRHERQQEKAITCRGVVVGVHRADVLVEGRIIVELKAVKSLDTVHFAVVRSYLRAWNLAHGLLLNFAAAPLEIRRVSSAVPRRASGVASPFPLS